MGNSSRKNVIIVGAGASKEFGLPIGDELKADIAKIADIKFGRNGLELISGDHHIVNALKLMSRDEAGRFGDIYPYQLAAWRIRDNMPLAPSIDNFLDTHRDNEKLVEFGKLAIVWAIANAERKSKLFVDQNEPDAIFPLSKISDTWIGKFFAILVAQRDFSSFVKALKNITFVSFNYDRCLHQFFCLASKSYFSLSDENVNELLDALEIIYPYGTIGVFQWNGSNRTNFGKPMSSQNLILASKSLQTFTEGTDSENIENIRAALGEAENNNVYGLRVLIFKYETIIR